MKIKAIAVILIISSILGACSKNSSDKNKETENLIYEAKNQNVSVLSKNDEEETGVGTGELEVVNPKEFGNAKEVLDNIVITSNVEVKKSKADELQIEFELDNVGVCIFAASKGKELSLPKETFVDSTKIEWTALTADEEYIFPYMKVNETGDMFMIDWTYKDYNFAICGKSPQNTSDRDMAGKIALAIIRNLGGDTQNNHEEITPTGYPSDEIQRPQIMYNGVLYYYTANGFDNPLPDGYEFVGEIKKVDNKQEPTANWCGSRVDIGQKIYASNNTSLIYLEYEKGYAAFAAVETEPEVKIDYGASSIYTKEEMDAAIELIKKEFNTWDGCKLHSISYSTDDECSESNIAWMNEMEKANDAKETFTQSIMFKSSFHSPLKGGGGFNADEEYTDWQWWLARSEGGQWKLMTWGY